MLPGDRVRGWLSPRVPLGPFSVLVLLLTLGFPLLHLCFAYMPLMTTCSLPFRVAHSNSVNSFCFVLFCFCIVIKVISACD